MTYIQPAIGGTVTIPTVRLRVTPGMVVFHRNGGTYRVSQYNGGFSITLRNLGLPNNPNPGSLIDSDDTALNIAGEPGVSIVETAFSGTRCDNRLPSAIGVKVCLLNHGFKEGDVLIPSEDPSVEFVLASAQTEEQANFVGIVQFVIDADSFVLLSGGLLKLYPENMPVWAQDGLEQGKTYYLSDVPGQLSLIPGTIPQVALVAYTQNTGFFYPASQGSPLSNENPNQLGVSSPGVALEASRGDHTHSHGNQGGGSLHPTATTALAGFMSSADKTKLNGVATGATNVPLSNEPPNQLGANPLPGTSNSASRGDHTHTHGNQVGGTLHALVTTLLAGFMSAEDKTKLDGFVPGAANNLAQLGADSKLRDDQIPAALLGGLQFQSTWNAATNTPTIPAAAVGNKGHYYIVSVDGSTNLDGITDWKMGDWAVSIGTAWVKIDNTDHVVSVAGKQGIITLDIADITGLQSVLDSIPTPSNATPQAPGVASPGSSLDYSRADHVHSAQEGTSALNAFLDPLFNKLPTNFSASGGPTYSEANSGSWWITRITGSGNTLALKEASGGALPADIRGCLEIVQPTGSDSYFSQIIANRRGALYWASGRTLFLTLWARVTSGSCTLTPTVRQFFGATGSALVDQAGSPASANLTGSWEKYTFEFAMPSVAEKTIAGTDHALQMYCVIGTGAKTVELAGLCLSTSNQFNETAKNWGRF
jgi:hypothetical protein